MKYDSLSRRGPAFAGSLLFLFLAVFGHVGCESEVNKRQEANDSLKACVNAYWQARAEGKAWQDTERCCASVDAEESGGKASRRDPVASQVSVERFEIRELNVKTDLERAEVKVWLEYSIPLIPTSLTNVVTERWERRDGVWRRVPSNLNAILVGAGRAK